MILTLLDRSVAANDMNVSGMRFHSLRGDLEGRYSVAVSGNWRITFAFENGHTVDVDYEDYHQGGKDMPMANPVHPGEIIKEVCLEALELTITDAAKHLGVTRQTLSDLVNCKSGVSPEMALRLSQAFGSSPEAWLGMQTAYDLWQVRQRRPDIKIERIVAA